MRVPPRPYCSAGRCPAEASLAVGWSRHRRAEEARARTDGLFRGVRFDRAACERRRESRYRAGADRIWLEWWDGGEFTGLSGRLLNVSRHGAMVLAAPRLREGQGVRLILEETRPRVGVEGRAVGWRPGEGGLNVIRLGFPGGCPDPFFEAAARGFEAWLSCERPCL